MGMLETTAVNISKLLEEMLYSCIFSSVFLTLPQLCSGFVVVLWWECSKLRPKKMGVKCSAGPILDVSSESLAWSHAGVSCLPNHPPAHESQTPAWCSAAGALLCSRAAGHCGLCTATLYPTNVQHRGCRDQPGLHEDTVPPPHVPKEQPWSFHLVS